MSAAAIMQSAIQQIAAPQRMTVATAAEKFMRLPSGGFSYNATPYMREPAECVASRAYDSVVFVGPAQTGKTESLVMASITYCIAASLQDVLLLQTSQDEARDFSRRRIDKMLDASPELSNRLRPGGNNDNTHDKYFRGGVIVTCKWPSKTVLAGKPIPVVLLTDYDRYYNVSVGEGDVWTLAAARTKTFMSRGILVAESSPSAAVVDLAGRKRSAHSAPDAGGIMGLYQTGDRRRIYGKCPECGEYFSPSPYFDEAAVVPEDGTPENRAAAVQLICSANGCLIDHKQQLKFKKSGRWLRDGETIDSNGSIHGDPITSTRASFWMSGWFAAFGTWQSIALNHLRAADEYERSGNEEPLRSTTNIDQGAPYVPKAISDNANTEWHSTDAERYIIPDWVRFIIATVDVQQGRFEVLISGVGPNWITQPINRFPIRNIDPARDLDDWNTITEQIINSTYRYADGRELRVLRTVVDSGGEQGVTDNAYAWFRSLRTKRISGRVYLVKGASSRDAPIARITRPNTRKKARGKGGASIGDVPLLSINTTTLKDAVWAGLNKEDEGPNYIHLPSWINDSYLDELSAEVREPRGWKKIRSRNETFDLLVYARAALYALGYHKINFDDSATVPSWALEYEANSEAMTSAERKKMKSKSAQRAKPKRRSRRSRNA